MKCANQTETALGETTELSIAGLHWKSRWRMNNGQPDSFVVPFPTNRTVNIVHHGTKKFEYGHYGIHLGQEDQLTFLGDITQKIKASFIDCRKGSPTLHEQLEIEFTPSSRRTLVIPAGIAHTFYNLENIDTINEFNLYLPEPDKIFDPNSLWKLENDIINVPIGSKKLPVVEPNPHQASELVYSRLAAFQEKILPNITAGFPEQFNFTDANNKTHSLLMRKKVDPVSNEAKKIEKLGSIEGVFWQDHLKVATGPDSAVLPLIRKSPFYVVEHGHQSYNHDSYGIHLGQEDRLTFLGRPGKKIHLTLVDCREGSKTLHKKEELVLEVSSFKELVIPQGVAHALRGMEGVYTLNRPFHFMDDRQNYRPGHDVIDWPIDCMNYPVYKINTIPTIDDYYIKSATEQKALMMKKSDYSAPRSQTFIDPKTKTEFRIVLRRRAENQMSEVEEIV